MDIQYRTSLRNSSSPNRSRNLDHIEKEVQYEFREGMPVNDNMFILFKQITEKNLLEEEKVTLLLLI